MLDVDIRGGELHFDASVTIRFMRTLRIPDDGRECPLPAGLGEFPIFHVADYADRVPASWRGRGGVFIPMYQREAMWISFSGRRWKPNAVKIGIAGINAISGGEWNETLSAHPQDYVVVPAQSWVAGIHTGDGLRQFVAAPLRRGHASAGHPAGGMIRIVVFEPKPGRFPDKPPSWEYDDEDWMVGPDMDDPELGVGYARQTIHPDVHGVDTWDLSNSGHLNVHIVNTRMFKRITGCPPPPSPVTAEAYKRAGVPWSALYEADMDDVPSRPRLRKAKSLNGRQTDFVLP
ncbi:MAG TPA: hypothetical protein PL151_00605 [Phycisphaerae bacterium]|nr:hypothetical protein [Phycisphaerae bacterium]HPU25632.1 hypothetical protein [Phycisphaerae bacterium]HQE26230.1 hypothetical protein [Phycisphaerae bacterium]